MYFRSRTFIVHKAENISNVWQVATIGKGIKVENFKVDKCLGVGFLGRQTVKTRRSTKIALVI